jgi:hypothetical protein
MHNVRQIEVPDMGEPDVVGEPVVCSTLGFYLFHLQPYWSLPPFYWSLPSTCNPTGPSLPSTYNPTGPSPSLTTLLVPPRVCASPLGYGTTPPVCFLLVAGCHAACCAMPLAVCVGCGASAESEHPSHTVAGRGLDTRGTSAMPLAWQFLCLRNGC